MLTLSLAAPAKINLGLQVLGRRADGYHEVVTVLQAIDLTDTVHIAEHDRIEGGTTLAGLTPERDLAVRAARRLHARLRPGRGAYLRVDKHIPAAAGLGGGSSDAAAVLLGLDALWRSHAGAAVVTGVARTLGADVPFFLNGGTALATGRGDEIQQLAAAPEFWVVLAKPDTAIATADVYAQLDPKEWSDGAETLRLAAAVAHNRLPLELLRNDLLAAATRLAPEIGDVLAALRSHGAEAALLAGSGPTCFGLHRTERAARRCAEALAQTGLWTSATRFRTRNRAVCDPR